MKKKKIFLGGTCQGYDWRTDLIYGLDQGKFECFNPVVSDWNEEAKKREIAARKISDICLYAITPDMIGCYSIAEVVDDSNKRPEKTVLMILDSEPGFSDKMLHSLQAVSDMVKRNGGQSFNSIDSFIQFVNNL